MAIDISDSLAAKSDQINAADLAAPVRCTVARVDYDPKADQPLTVHMTEGKPWRPSKGMRRVLAQVWGTDASAWAGRGVTLFNDPSAMWAGKPVGGIRIKAITGLRRAQDFPVKTSRTAFTTYRIEPLADAPPAPAPAASTPPEDAPKAISAWLAEREIGADQLDKWLVSVGKSPLDDMHPSEAARLLDALPKVEGAIRGA